MTIGPRGWILAVLLVGPAAWLLDLQGGYVLTYWACAHDRSDVLHLLTAAATLIALGGAAYGVGLDAGENGGPCSDR